MTEEELRLECLRLAIPKDISNPDVPMVLDRARAYFAFVQADKPKSPATTDKVQKFSGQAQAAPQPQRR